MSRAWTWVLLVPFLLLSLIPSGLMPQRGADGVLMLVICTGVDMVEVAVDPRTFELLPEGARNTGNDSKAPCDWSATYHQLALTPALGTLISAGTTVGVLSLVAPVVLTAAQATGLPPATGPPVYV